MTVLSQPCDSRESTKCPASPPPTNPGASETQMPYPAITKIASSEQIASPSGKGANGSPSNRRMLEKLPTAPALPSSRVASSEQIAPPTGQGVSGKRMLERLATTDVKSPPSSSQGARLDGRRMSGSNDTGKKTSGIMRSSLAKMRNSIGAIREMKKRQSQSKETNQSEEDATVIDPSLPEHLKHLHVLMQECGESELLRAEKLLESQGALATGSADEMPQDFDILEWLESVGPEESPKGKDEDSNQPTVLAPVDPNRNSFSRHSASAAAAAAARGSKLGEVKSNTISHQILGEFDVLPRDKSDLLPRNKSDSDLSDISEPRESRRGSKGQSGKKGGKASENRASTEPVLPVLSLSPAKKATRQEDHLEPRCLSARTAGDASEAPTKSAIKRRHSMETTGTSFRGSITSSDVSTAPSPATSIQDMAQERVRKEKLLADMNELAIKAGLALDSHRKSFDVKSGNSTFDIEKNVMRPSLSSSNTPPPGTPQAPPTVRRSSQNRLSLPRRRSWG